MKLAIAVVITLALIGPASARNIKPVRVSTLKVTVFGCNSMTMTQRVIDLMHAGQDGDSRARMEAHDMMLEGSELGVCHFFDPSPPVKVLIEHTGEDTMSCVTDGKDEPRIKPCYWVPTAWLP